jgi:hypothetical protein
MTLPTFADQGLEARRRPAGVFHSGVVLFTIVLIVRAQRTLGYNDL